MQKPKPKRKIHPALKQRRPGLEFKMTEDPPVFDVPLEEPHKKLEGKVAIITGGDSGIGRAVAVLFAKHGASVAIGFLPEEKKDAEITAQYIEQMGQQCILLPADISKEVNCISLVRKAVKKFHRLDILVNNAGLHYSKDNIADITKEQLIQTFSVNIFSMFYLVKEAIKHMKKGACIINTTSVTAYRGSAHLIDYAASKGAIVSFTRSLASALVDKKIRVNAVAPGPIWTPLIISSMEPKRTITFGTDSPMGRPGQPVEVAPSYLFLACDDSSYMTGQVLHPNGGEIVNG
ncbi:MAG TPA: SDR family oxidoreductase [Flavobacteriales bacterium]|nr:SDR family oxidoreductase [Flavobacteriales bacterium]